MLRRLGAVPRARYEDTPTRMAGSWIYILASGDFWCRVTIIESYLMVFVDQSSFFSKLLGRSPGRLPRYLGHAWAAELASDERFHDVAWFLDSEVLSPGVEGAKEPVGP